MANTKSTTNAGETDQVFAVYTKESGSYTAGEYRLVPLAAQAVPAEMAARIDPDTSPVALFKSEDAAKEHVEKLRAEFDRKRNPKKA